jgi:hypothetical protein
VKRFRMLLLASIATSILITALAGPAAAATNKGRMIIINGRPGSNVEVCINGREVKHSLKYGRSAVRHQNPGVKVLKFKKKSVGNCKGKLLAARTVVLADDDDRTIVVTRAKPDKVVVFPKTPLTNMVLRHAADIGTAAFKWAIPENGIPWFPAGSIAADEPYVKGDWGYGGSTVIYWAYQPPDQKPIAGPFAVDIDEATQRNESVLVGTWLGNVRFVHVGVLD